jgi:mannose-6-phosphate isomerase-like protein (cupin superfamily)
MKLLVLLLAALPLVAADVPGFGHWKAAELKSRGTKLAGKLNATKVAAERIGTFGNHFMMVAHREGSGRAELHDTQADIFVAQEGEATLVYGGRIVEPKSTGPGETEGSSIEGGSRITLAPGDMVHIPARVAHQLLLAPGVKFTYAVVKIDVK